MRKSLICAAVAATLAPAAWATNGMNMEGYGPIATAMGGASFAYDGGNAGIINNPATLGMMADGTSRLDVAVGGLHPSLTTNGVDSSATAFYMPAVGYIRKDKGIAYGVGVMAQGGMGATYPSSAIYGGLSSMGGNPAVSDPGLENKSQVGVGRVIFPLAFNVNDKFTVGGSVDFVWAGMDVKWLMDGSHFGNMMPGNSQRFGTLGGNMLGTFGGDMAAIGGDLNWGYFNFAQGNYLERKATSTGWAGNIGFTWKATDKLTIGGIYHAKTNLGDMTTSDNGATASFNVTPCAQPGSCGGAGAQPAQTVNLTGKVTVKNFQWPETYGLGMAYQVDDRWMIAADYKRINWSGVMQNFSMTFLASSAGSNDYTGAGMSNYQNQSLDMVYYQRWEDQNVFMIGASYKYSDALTLRGGVNIANNPVPDAYVSPLFPAIETNHIMGGFGYAVDKTSGIDFSLVYVPKVTVTNQWSTALGGAASGNQTISMSEINWQLMYSKRF